MNNHPAEVLASVLADAEWFTSSYSNGGGNCVEAADLTATPRGSVALRDSKVPGGPVLLLDPDPFAAFIADVRAGRFDV
ncbi:DUF397 domain-containing protein [Streptomyces profundus]|uniref:DUF397 domain-containing protein n=1 Tax=Streptomyces profundus TaxID=2867410 RepID=UPI001D1670AC|nr:DUF397 domain-containing protein [Streptomyces sp. MA3_2.13]UED83188.1 DUF397 domain-containing protein [Streptomyces sp. MA3_2.13]